MKSALTILFISFAFMAAAQQFTFEESVDLNSDSHMDAISLSTEPDSYDFVLHINAMQVAGSFEDGEPDGFQIVDINKWDSYKEVAVHTSGSSSDDVYVLYWYDGSDIILMDRLSRWPTFLGNGIVYVDNARGFWTQRDKYVLDNKLRKLELVPQDAYYVGVKVQVSKSFPIYKTRQLHDQVALLGENTEIELIMCDLNDSGWNDQLYLIRSSSNLLGWALLRDIFDNCTGFQLAD